MSPVLLIASLCLVCIVSENLRVESEKVSNQCEIPLGGVQRGERQKLPKSPPDLFPPLHQKIFLVGAGSWSLSFKSSEPCTKENCLPICWYYKKENDSIWGSYLQTSEHRLNEPAKFKKLTPNTIYQIQSKILTHEDITEVTGSCPPPANFSCANPVHARTCEDVVPSVRDLTVHFNDKKGVVLSWLPPQSKCTALLEYQVTINHVSSVEDLEGGRFWSNATRIVTWPTGPCVGYPERHCFLVEPELSCGDTITVRVRRIQDKVMSDPSNITFSSLRQLGPGPPRSLECVDKQPHSLELRWELPLAPKGVISHALITLNASAISTNFKTCVRGQSHMVRKVTGLRPDTLFNMSVRYVLENEILGEPAYVSARTAPERTRITTIKPVTPISITTEKSPRSTRRNIIITTATPTAKPKPRSITIPKSWTICRSVTTENPLPNKTRQPDATGKPNTTAQPIASTIYFPGPLTTPNGPFNSSWMFVGIVGMVLVVTTIASFTAGFCLARQIGRSQDMRSKRSMCWGCCGAKSDEYDAVHMTSRCGGGRGVGRWVRSRMRLPRSFHEYEELNSAWRSCHRGPRDCPAAVACAATTLDSSASRSTDCSDYFFRGRLLRLPSLDYLAPRLISCQWNPAFDSHEYEVVKSPPSYEVTLATSERRQQPLNASELLDAQMTYEQGPSTSTTLQTTRERPL